MVIKIKGKTILNYSLNLIAIIFIYIGTDSIILFLYPIILGGGIDIDIDIFSFLGILIGRGLLLRKEVWRKITFVLNYVSIVSLTFLIIAIIINPDNVTMGGVINPVQSLFKKIIIISSLLILSIFIFFVLNNKYIKEQFRTSSKPSILWKKWWKILVIIFSILIIINNFFNFIIKKTDKNGSHESGIYLFNKKVRKHDLFDFSIPYSLDIRIKCKLYIIKSGTIKKVCTHIIKRIPDRLNIEKRMNESGKTKVTLQMIEKNTDNNKIRYSLISKGASRTMTTDAGNTYNAIQKKNIKKVINKIKNITLIIPEEKEYLLYIIGDNAIQAQYDMSLEEFNNKNKGTYLVVTIKWNHNK